MLFYQPFVFASDFITHILILVLFGMLVVEYFQLRAKEMMSARRDSFIPLCLLTGIAGTWIVVEYFAPASSAEYHIFYHWMSIAISIYLVLHLFPLVTLGVLRVAAFIFALSGMFHIGFDLASFFDIVLRHNTLIRALFRLIETITLFYFVLGALISLDKEAPRTARIVGRRFIITFVIVILAAALIYSAVPEHKKIGHQGPDEPPTEVTVRLKWIPQAQFAGMYIADQKGHYKDENLTVSLLPFDYEHYPIDDVTKGYGTFGIAGAEEVLAARASGKPLVALSVIYQETPVAVTVPAASSIEHIADLQGKKIGMWGALDDAAVDGDIIALTALLKAEGLSLRDVIPVFVEFEGVDALITGKVDAVMTYITDEPIRLKSRGLPVRNLTLADAGIPFYADVLFTTEDIVHDKPDLVRRFVKATLRGWEYAILSPEEGVEATLLYEDVENYGELSRKHERAVLDASIPLIKPEPVSRVGEMSHLLWQDMYDFLRKNGFIENEFNVRDAYTTRFLPV